MNSTVFLTVLSGVITYVLGQLVLKLVIEPVQELRKTIGVVAHAMIERAPIIPHEVQARIFNYCETVLARAPMVLRDRDRRRWGERDPELVEVRDAALYVLSIASGMRNEEAIGVEADSWRKEVKDGVEYHWVATVEHKTLKGKVECRLEQLAQLMILL